MKRYGNVDLSLPDDLFSTQEQRDDAKREHIEEISLEDLVPFRDHPFQVKDDEEMQKMAESIKEYGVLTPAIARPLPDGKYELISGHRRMHASALAGKTTLPVIVRDMDDDAATILMVDSNLQRENILPSERAKAYKMKLDALRHQGQRSTSVQLAPRLSTEIIGEEAGMSKDTVKRYIRLNNLIPELQDAVDKKAISFNPAVELSYLQPEEQKQFLQALEECQTAPSLSQAQRMKKMSQNKEWSEEAVKTMLSEDKKAPLNRVVLDEGVLTKYFPKSYTSRQIQDTIVKLLDQWKKKRSREMER
ncbi:MAG: ParB/RepB/Spo0J family partition protein [Bulleidia sp.]|nr:ParB/RepB/Spo0J family partition protein [Bulleidia sp.]